MSSLVRTTYQKNQLDLNYKQPFKASKLNQYSFKFDQDVFVQPVSFSSSTRIKRFDADRLLSPELYEQFNINPVPLMTDPRGAKGVEEYINYITHQNSDLATPIFDSIVALSRQGVAGPLFFRTLYNQSILPISDKLIPIIEDHLDGRLKSLVSQICAVVSRHTNSHDLTHILDIGCGDGELTRKIGLRLQIPNIHGLEVTGHPGEVIQTEGMQVWMYDGHEIPVSMPQPNFVMLNSLIHHLPDENAATELLTNIYNKLEPGGYLFIRDQDVDDPIAETFWQFRHAMAKMLGVDAIDMTPDRLYKPFATWNSKLQTIGFVFIDCDTDKSRPDALGGSYNALFRKPLAH